MSQVTIRWTQRAAGRWDGHEETVEMTPFIQGCIDNNRVVVLETFEVGEPGAEGLTVAKPLYLDPTPNEKPGPRRPRSIDG